jgi:GNAT superfamily N-acetyltransferase
VRAEERQRGRDEELTVRRITPYDWGISRALRLEALADSPIAFEETLEAAQAKDDGSWQARAARGAEGGDCFQVLALADGRAVASSVCFLEDGEAWLAGVYVSPAFRGAGLLGRLVEQCAGWARERGSTRLLLEVHEANPRARAAYARLGFVPTGETRPYPLEAGGCELTMALPLVRA